MATVRGQDGSLNFTARRLAPSEKTTLLDALEDFANLKGSTLITRDIQVEDVKRFRLKHPRFFERDSYDVAEGRAVWKGLQERQGIRYFRTYQRWLRALWRGRRADPRLLDILLG